MVDPDTGEMVGSYEYDDQGFRVRKLAKTEIDGEEKQVEVLYPSIYFGVERQKTLDGRDIPNREEMMLLPCSRLKMCSEQQWR